ncbi:MAG TPA: hypothetical protein VI431_02865 [Candidatus Acidoferrum sp.]
MDKLVKIETLLNESSRKFLTEAQLRPDPALVAQGWQRRFTADEQRIQEVVELYKQLGYEVRIEPVTTENLQDGCHDCQASSAIQLFTIYTRKR